MMVRVMALGIVLVAAGAAVTQAGEEEAPPATQPSMSTTEPASMRGRLSAEEMLNQMLQPTTQTSAPLQPAPDGGGGIINHNTINAVAPGAPLLDLRPEGTLVTDQIGRLTRTQNGTGWEFTPVTDGKQMLDPAFRVLPNRNLTNMINASIGNNDDIRFRVSGELTEFDNRNYILIEKVVRVAHAPLKAK